PPRQRGVHGSGEDLRRSGRSTLTSSSFFPNLFPFLPNPPSGSTHRPRYRYVAFRLGGARPFQREEVAAALRALSPRLWLVQFNGGSGLVRTTKLEKDAAIRALNGVDRVGGEGVQVPTVGTPGTIRADTRDQLTANY